MKICELILLSFVVVLEATESGSEPHFSEEDLEATGRIVRESIEKPQEDFLQFYPEEETETIDLSYYDWPPDTSDRSPPLPSIQIRYEGEVMIVEEIYFFKDRYLESGYENLIFKFGFVTRSQDEDYFEKRIKTNFHLPLIINEIEGDFRPHSNADTGEVLTSRLRVRYFSVKIPRNVVFLQNPIRLTYRVEKFLGSFYYILPTNDNRQMGGKDVEVSFENRKVLNKTILLR